MRKHILLSGVAVTALVVALGTAAAAQRGGARGPGAPAGDGAAVSDAQSPGARPGRGFGRGGNAAPEARLARRLDLSAEQREAIGAILRTSRDQTAPVAEELRAAHHNLRQAIFADTPDATAVEGLQAQVTALQQRVADLRLQAQTSIAAELTDAQRAEWLATPERGGGRFGALGRRVGPGGPGGPGEGRGPRGPRG